MTIGSVWVFAAAGVISALAGGPLLRLLRRAGIRQTVSENAPERHAGKQGTPTMGGLVMLAGFTAAFLAAAPGRREAWAAWALAAPWA